MTKGGRKPQKSRGERKDELEKKRDERAKRTAYRKEKQAKAYYALEDDEHYASFNNQLQIIGLKIKDIPGDGNCLFRALADQLEGDHNRHAQLRKNTVHFMRENVVDFEPFYDGDSSFPEYLKDLEKDGTYAGNDAIVAFARNNDVDVIIHQYNSPRFVISAPVNPRNIELHLAYHNGEHYSSLRRLNNNSDGPAFVSCSGQSICSELSKPKSLEKSNTKSSSKYKLEDNSHSNYLSETERSIMKSTLCEDADLVRRSLEENDGDIDSTIAYLLQLLSFDEMAEQITAEKSVLQEIPERACLKEECNSCEEQCKCHKQVVEKRHKSLPNSQTKNNNDAVHLSNRQRKELAKQEKKKRRQEAQKKQMNSAGKPNGETDTPDDLGTVAI